MMIDRYTVYIYIYTNITEYVYIYIYNAHLFIDLCMIHQKQKKSTCFFQGTPYIPSHQHIKSQAMELSEVMVETSPPAGVVRSKVDFFWGPESHQFYTPRKLSAGWPQNDGLENVCPASNMVSFWVSMLNFRGR